MSEISYKDFLKIEVRVGKIVEASVPEGSERLIELKVNFGDLGEKTIFAGIKKWYDPEQLLGKKSLFVYNLEAKSTPFGDSEGMLFAVGGDEARVIFLQDDMEEGSLLR